MRIVLWIGNEPNQKAFANKLHEVFPVLAIVTESRRVKKSFKFRIILEKLVERTFLSPIGKSWWGMLKIYNERYPRYPNAEILDVENINSELVYSFTAKHNPDLILVSGTRLVKDKMFNLRPTIGILNLHTGLSPYVKGGPNCTNWCIANKEFHLIGNTVMWIDKGIDTGDVLTTEFTPFVGDENLLELHIKVMEHAHLLYLNAVRFVLAGNKQRVKQSEIGYGRTFYSKQWTLKQKINLIRYFPEFRAEHYSGNIVAKRKDIRTVELKEL